MTKLDDNHLLEKFRRDKDHQAFECLVEKYAPIVHGSALRRIGSHHLAQDITQKVFIHLTQKARSIKAGTPLIGWLHQVTRTTTIDLIRSETARKKRENAYSMDPSLNSDSPQTQWEDIAPILDATLDDLSETDRNAILLRYFEGNSLAAIATSQGVTTEAARKRVTRALEKIRQNLSRKGVTASALTITSSIQAHGNTLLTPAYLSQLKTASTAAIPTTLITTQILLMTTKTKITIAAAAAFIGAAVITTKTINNKTAEEKPNPSMTSSQSTARSTVRNTEKTKSSNTQESNSAHASGSSIKKSYLNEQALFMDPKAIKKAQMLLQVITSTPRDLLIDAINESQIDPAAKSYGLSETLASALQKQLDASKEKSSIATKAYLNSLLKNKDLLEEFLVLEQMTDHKKFTPAHQARIEEISKIIEGQLEETLQQANISKENVNLGDTNWFEQADLIEAVKNSVPVQEHNAFDKLVESQSQIHREKVAFDRSQKLAKELGLTLTQRENIFDALYENTDEENIENISSILTPEQMETYSELIAKEKSPGGRIGIIFGN